MYYHVFIYYIYVYIYQIHLRYVQDMFLPYLVLIFNTPTRKLDLLVDFHRQLVWMDCPVSGGPKEDVTFSYFDTFSGEMPPLGPAPVLQLLDRGRGRCW